MSTLILTFVFKNEEDGTGLISRLACEFTFWVTLAGHLETAQDYHPAPVCHLQQLQIILLMRDHTPTQWVFSYVGDGL